MQTLADRPDLAKMVVSFKGYLYHVVYPARRTTLLGRLANWFRLRKPKHGLFRHNKAGQDAYEEVLARALTAMVNLRSLTLPSLEHGSRARYLMMKVIIPHLKDRLETFEISIQSPFPFGALVPFEVNRRPQSMAILSTQANLRVLRIPHNVSMEFDWERFNEELHMPVLMELACIWTTACALGKGRPSIRALELLDSPIWTAPGEATAETTNKDWEQLAKSFPNLVALSVHTLRTQFYQIVLKSLVDNFISLETLEFDYIEHKDFDIVGLHLNTPNFQSNLTNLNSHHIACRAHLPPSQASNPQTHHAFSPGLE